MARRPPEDPRVADLARYRKAREQRRRRQPAPPSGPRLLGSNPRARLILALIAAAAVLLWLLPLLRRA